MTFFETITASRVCRCLVSHSNVHLIVVLMARISQGLLEFFLSQAHTSGEVGTLCIFLLMVYFRTFLPIFIEISSYLTDPDKR